MKENANVNLVIEEMGDWLDEHLGNSQFSNLVLHWQGLLMGISDLDEFDVDPFEDSDNE